MYRYLGNTDILIYDIGFIFVITAALIYNLSQLNRKKQILGKCSQLLLKKFQASPKLAIFNVTFFAVIETVIITWFQFGYVGFTNSTFGDLVGTGANYFGLLFAGPLILSFLFLMLGVDLFKQFDLITPAFPIALVFTKLTCFCDGCCRGIECSFGMYNHSTNAVEFPAQLVETGLALLIFIFLLVWRKKTKEGTLFPIYLIVYTSTRFFSEFLRCEENVLWIFKRYHILCIIGFIVGIVELLIVRKYGDRIQRMFNKISLPWIKEKEIKHK